MVKIKPSFMPNDTVCEPLNALSRLKLEFLLQETERLTTEMQNRPLDEELIQRSHLFLKEYKRRLSINSSPLAATNLQIIANKTEDL